MTETIFKSEYKCPLCQVNLVWQYGNVFHINDPKFGLTLFCNNIACQCEVFGYTNTQKIADAFEIIEGKYTAHIVK